MARTPVATRDSVPTDQRDAYDEIIAARGGPIASGPVSVLINRPEMAKRARLGLAVRVTNNSDRDITLYPGGIGARLVVGDEQSEPLLFASETGGDLLSGVSEEFQIIFSLKQHSMDAVESFR